MAEGLHAGRLRRHKTWMVYAKKSGAVIHISHVGLAEGASASPELLAETERRSLEHACRIHGVAEADVAVIALDPEQFKPLHIYTVDPANGTVHAQPATQGRGGSPRPAN